MKTNTLTKLNATNSESISSASDEKGINVGSLNDDMTIDFDGVAYAVENEKLVSMHELMYAGWENEEIGMLDNMTPAEAIKTAAGLAKVKDLVNQMSDMPADTSVHRPKMDYSFLLERLGINASTYH